jgi:hypothetical protein
VATRERELPADTEVEEATRESMTGGSFREARGALSSWRVMAMREDWPAEMETPEAEPWKSRVPEESKA